MNQQQMSERNKVGWNQNAYQAWVSRHGQPTGLCKTIKGGSVEKGQLLLR